MNHIQIAVSLVAVTLGLLTAVPAMVWIFTGKRIGFLNNASQGDA